MRKIKRRKRIVAPKINKIYNCNCLDLMLKMPDGFVDLVVTSPPYDNLRTYKGYSFNFKSIAKELFRVTKQGGVVVWIVADATIKGSETGTSFRQALYFKKIGFNLHDTMIWTKDGGGGFGSSKCYAQNFEYMFIFSKGKIKTTNLIRDKLNLSFGTGERWVTNRRLVTGETKRKKIKPPAKFRKRNNYWYIPRYIPIQSGNGHPAVFPEKLAKDHIISWSNIGDLVYDPLMGSGTTAKMALHTKRNYIGSEISEEYCIEAKKRINEGLISILSFVKTNYNGIYKYIKENKNEKR
ncbi:MAG TPA: site-specific DNA-methyltransferase [Candidatus Glassbacteria bacterium]|nr:site-specific DNA-methyltransferase [Candidatus Glassbacteria bacterium]